MQIELILDTLAVWALVLYALAVCALVRCALTVSGVAHRALVRYVLALDALTAWLWLWLGWTISVAIRSRGASDVWRSRLTSFGQGGVAISAGGMASTRCA